MDDALRIISEMHLTHWHRFRGSLDDLGDDEIQWRFLPQANSINIIVRHLRIEGEWHLRSIQTGEPMPTIATAASQEAIDAIPFEFSANLNTLERVYTEFCDALRTESLETLKDKTATAYGDAIRGKGVAFMLAYHQATHLAMHSAQIRTIRNLYRTTRGQRARYHPQNPTYPGSGSGSGDAA
jgi:DinB superfamily